MWVHPSVEAEAREWEEWRSAARARVAYRAGAHVPTRDACEAELLNLNVRCFVPET